MRIIRKRTSVTDPTQAEAEISSLQGKTAGEESATTNHQAKLNTPSAVESQTLDSDTLDLSTIKLPDDFEAKLQQETASGSVTPPPSRTTTAPSGGANPFNEMREDFLLDSFQQFCDDEFFDVESDLNFEGEGLSGDYVDFLLSYE